MLNTFWNNFVYLFGSLFTTSAYLVREEPIYDEDFLSKFTQEKDKEKLDHAVAKLKAGNKKVETITLENNEKVTIMIK